MKLACWDLRDLMPLQHGNVGCLCRCQEGQGWAQSIDTGSAANSVYIVGSCACCIELYNPSYFRHVQAPRGNILVWKGKILLTVKAVKNTLKTWGRGNNLITRGYFWYIKQTIDGGKKQVLASYIFFVPTLLLLPVFPCPAQPEIRDNRWLQW